MEPIAIIGMSCRFPGAADCGALWEILRDGRDVIAEIPSDRWDVERYYAPPPVVRGRMSTRWGGFIDGVDQFDAEFFGISAREAMFMDPQQRVLLEVAWHALEDAAIPAPTLSESNTGVFVGASSDDYSRLLCRDQATMDAYSSTGTILAIVANRLSYFLNLRGPSIVVDTACSSSLVSVHLACRSLASRDCDLALAGGVNLILGPEATITLSQRGLMSPDGRCKAFDASANGYVRSEGCGVLVLKRLADATADGDRILAVIRGSAVNQDGATNGITSPSASAQQTLIRRALSDAGVEAPELSYIEAHGSGTPLGDIVEWRSLRAVLVPERAPADRCAIGSIKTNIGHAESAAGIAGLLKVVLSLQNETIPRNLHLQNLNPRIRAGGTPLFIPTDSQPWPRNGTPRLAGISSFGIGGTNAHIILGEAPPDNARTRDGLPPPYVLPISSKTEAGLGLMVQRYESFLSDHPEVALEELCRTAACGRTHFFFRRAMILPEPTPEALAIAQSYERGNDIDWTGLYGPARPSVQVPRYAFQRQRYWFDDNEMSPGTTAFRRPRARARAAHEGISFGRP
ncbi:MAG TPA: beta-ketoacyl synthase N-terminal-like domain-containing protein [Thermoanaerobaculia bacterium]|nr:beta-ketoacyl synthase N-terminal-like domain-containing protein [Thermoanaerobaculia bacterium]